MMVLSFRTEWGQLRETSFDSDPLLRAHYVAGSTASDHPTFGTTTGKPAVVPVGVTTARNSFGNCGSFSEAGRPEAVSP